MEGGEDGARVEIGKSNTRRRPLNIYVTIGQEIWQEHRKTRANLFRT